MTFPQIVKHENASTQNTDILGLNLYTATGRIY
jgi:hypothetical protein